MEEKKTKRKDVMVDGERLWTGAALSATPSSENFVELDEVLYTGAVVTSRVLDMYPDLRKMSKRNQLILAGSAMGMSVRAIGQAVGLKRTAVWTVLKNKDPDGLIRMTDEGRQAFVTSVVASRTLEALLAITPEKFEDSSARDLSVIAKNLTAINEKAKMQKEFGSSAGQLESLMGELETEQMATADVVEVVDAEMIKPVKQEKEAKQGESK